MKKFTEKINDSDGVIETLNSMTNDQLKARLEYLKQEFEEIKDDIASIVDILDGRRLIDLKKLYRSLPNSIFDLSKEDLLNLFKPSNSSDEVSFKKRYFEQLLGFEISKGRSGGSIDNQLEFKVTTYEEDKENLELVNKSFNLLISVLRPIMRSYGATSRGPVIVLDSDIQKLNISVIRSKGSYVVEIDYMSSNFKFNNFISAYKKIIEIANKYEDDGDEYD